MPILTYAAFKDLKYAILNSKHKHVSNTDIITKLFKYGTSLQMHCTRMDKYTITDIIC